jgi:hypothetical protein
MDHQQSLSNQQDQYDKYPAPTEEELNRWMNVCEIELRNPERVSAHHVFMARLIHDIRCLRKESWNQRQLLLQLAKQYPGLIPFAEKTK